MSFVYSCETLKPIPTQIPQKIDTTAIRQPGINPIPCNYDSIIALCRNISKQQHLDITRYISDNKMLRKINDSTLRANNRLHIINDSISRANNKLLDSIAILTLNGKKIKNVVKRNPITKPVIKKAAVENSKSNNIHLNDNNYAVFTVNYPIQKIGMLLNGSGSDKIKSIDEGIRRIEAEKQEVLFMTNGGMYKSDNSPQGLYVENGKELNPIDIKTSGSGNFYMQPNGVFILTKTNAYVIPTAEYNKYKSNALFATQSGPMLVTNGTINSNFTKGSANTNIRSGVGIRQDGAVIFAISDAEVNFHDFAELFVKELKCRNALYLDGAISRMYLPRLNRNQKGGNFGVLIYSSVRK